MIWSHLRAGQVERIPLNCLPRKSVFPRPENIKCGYFSRETNTICEHHSYMSQDYLLICCTFNTVHKYFSKNIFHNLGLRFLVHLCTDIGLKEVQEYATKLKRLEKMKEIREQVFHMGRKLLLIF